MHELNVESNGAVHWAITCLTSYDRNLGARYLREALRLQGSLARLEERVLADLRKRDPSLADHIQQSCHTA